MRSAACFGDRKEIPCAKRKVFPYQIKPQRLLRDAINAGHGQWAAWTSGRSSPTMKVVDRLRAYMAAHPADTYQARKPGAAA
jgi:hypothetical protein